MSDKTKSKGITGIVIISMCVALLVIINVLFSAMSDTISIYLGTTETAVGSDVELSYAAGTSGDTIAENGREISTRIAEEGFVLLKNDNNTLPLANGSKVSIFNPMSYNYVIGGTGSAGGWDDKYTTSMYETFNNAGLNVNKAAWEWLDDAVGGDGDAATYERGARDKNADGTSGTKLNAKYGDISSSDWTGYAKILEFPKSVYTNNITTTMIGDYKTAIVTFSRSGAEGASPSFDIEKAGNTLNRTYLQLSDNEIDLLEFCADKFDKTIVLINSAAAVELGFLDKAAYKIAACVWIGHPGEAGMLGLANMLVKDSSGKAVSPSGKLVDTFAYDMSTMPSYYTNGDSKYNNSGTDWTTRVSGFNGFYLYMEGIYVGYRWYETADAAGYFDSAAFKSATFKNDGKTWQSGWGGMTRSTTGGYDKVVQFPFGYGLSYTSFTQTIKSDSIDLRAGKSNTITVNVKNTGAVASRDVVQIYMQAPYNSDTAMGISGKGLEKSNKVLVAFAKTAVIQPGETLPVEVTFETDDLASYDYCGYGSYVLEKGEYTFHVGENAHDTYSGATIKKNLGSSVIYDDIHAGKRASDNVTAVNQLDDVSAGDGNLTEDGYLSRNNFAAGMTEIKKYQSDQGVSINRALGTKQTAAVTTANQSYYDYTFSYYKNGVKTTATKRLYIQAGTQSFYMEKTPDGLSLDDESYEVTWGSKKTSLTLEDMKDEDGVAYAFDDPKWQTLMDQVTMEEAIKVQGNSGWSTPAVASVGKLANKQADGPGEANHKTFSGNTWWPCAVVIASTWDVDLAVEQGIEYGKQAAFTGLAGAYAPAMNTHRSPFGGRNFEYYSEDGFIAGKIGAQVVIGIQSTSTMVFIKHFMLNDGDSNRDGAFTWANEQSIREVYGVPYEISVKQGGALGMMACLNRTGMSWGHFGLFNNILREEWGFKGFLITDGVGPVSGYSMYNPPSLCLASGVSMLITGNYLVNSNPYPLIEGTGATTTSYGQYMLRLNTQRMLYQLVASGDPLRKVVPNNTWKIAWIIVDVALGAGIVLTYIFLVHRQLVMPLIRKKK